MKVFTKALAFLMIACLAVAAVACQGGSSSNRPTPAADDPGQRFVSGGITQEMINNYVIRYKVTEPQSQTDEEGNLLIGEDGAQVVEEVTTEYVEVGYNNIFLGSSDGGETFAFLTGGACFAVTSQNDKRGRGYLNAHKQYTESDVALDQLGTETICGYDATQYYYKSGLFQIHMSVNSDLDITLKYVSENMNPKSFEVTELQFGVINAEGSAYKFDDLLDRIPPEPTPVPETVAEEG